MIQTLCPFQEACLEHVYLMHGGIEQYRLGRGVTGSECGDLGAWARGSQVQALWTQPASPLKWSLAQRPVWFEMRATGPGLPRALAAREG